MAGLVACRRRRCGGPAGRALALALAATACGGGRSRVEALPAAVLEASGEPRANLRRGDGFDQDLDEARAAYRRHRDEARKKLATSATARARLDVLDARIEHEKGGQQ